MITEIELPKEHGLRKVARLVNFVVDEDQRKITVNYCEHLLADNGKSISKSEIKSYHIQDKERITRMIPTPVQVKDPNNPDADPVTLMKDQETVVQEEDLSFKAWEDQIGGIIRDSITTKLKSIYKIA